MGHLRALVHEYGSQPVGPAVSRVVTLEKDVPVVDVPAFSELTPHLQKLLHPQSYEECRARWRLYDKITRKED